MADARARASVRCQVAVSYRGSHGVANDTYAATRIHRAGTDSFACFGECAWIGKLLVFGLPDRALIRVHGAGWRPRVVQRIVFSSECRKLSASQLAITL